MRPLDPTHGGGQGEAREASATTDDDRPLSTEQRNILDAIGFGAFFFGLLVAASLEQWKYGPPVPTQAMAPVFGVAMPISGLLVLAVSLSYWYLGGARKRWDPMRPYDNAPLASPRFFASIVLLLAWLATILVEIAAAR